MVNIKHFFKIEKKEKWRDYSEDINFLKKIGIIDDNTTNRFIEKWWKKPTNKSYKNKEKNKILNKMFTDYAKEMPSIIINNQKKLNKIIVNEKMISLNSEEDSDFIDKMNEIKDKNNFILNIYQNQNFASKKFNRNKTMDFFVKNNKSYLKKDSEQFYFYKKLSVFRKNFISELSEEELEKNLISVKPIIDLQSENDNKIIERTFQNEKLNNLLSPLMKEFKINNNIRKKIEMSEKQIDNINDAYNYLEIENDAKQSKNDSFQEDNFEKVDKLIGVNKNEFIADNDSYQSDPIYEKIEKYFNKDNKFEDNEFDLTYERIKNILNKSSTNLSNEFKKIDKSAELLGVDFNEHFESEDIEQIFNFIEKEIFHKRELFKTHLEKNKHLIKNDIYENFIININDKQYEFKNKIFSPVVEEPIYSKVVKNKKNYEENNFELRLKALLKEENKNNDFSKDNSLSELNYRTPLHEDIDSKDKINKFLTNENEVDGFKTNNQFVDGNNKILTESIHEVDSKDNNLNFKINKLNKKIFDQKNEEEIPLKNFKFEKVFDIFKFSNSLCKEEKLDNYSQKLFFFLNKVSNSFDENNEKKISLNEFKDMMKEEKKIEELDIVDKLSASVFKKISEKDIDNDLKLERSLSENRKMSLK